MDTKIKFNFWPAKSWNHLENYLELLIRSIDWFRNFNDNSI